MPYLALALLSGIPALVYEVVWTREVALLLGSQVEATSIVLAVFFGGMALGARWLGVVSDRARAPLRIYALLEIGAGALAALTLLALRTFGSGAMAGLSPGMLLLLTASILLPPAILLGGTLPALLRAAERDASRAARTGGWLVAANTTGAAGGVAVSTGTIPVFGLGATLLGACAAALAIGAVAFWFARSASVPMRDSDTRSPALPRGVLVATTVAGVSTLAFEVLAARMAGIQLGSSLYAWALVLGLFLLGLAFGNFVAAPRAARTMTPGTDLGAIETLTALALAGGLSLFAPSGAEMSRGITASSLGSLFLGILPAAIGMGAAFPFFVRLAVKNSSQIGGAFGAVSALNTLGGVAGSLLAPLVLLPAWGLVGGALACAALNLSIGVAFLIAGAPNPRTGLLRAGIAALCALAATAPYLRPPATPSGYRLLFVEHGRQASAAVVRTPTRRELIVDGDPEASTYGTARATEELLALLPLTLHPAPLRFLEIGLGSGITLGAASRFPLERIDCVEIAGSVLAAASFFRPENLESTSGSDPRIHLIRADGRAYLLDHPNEYDVIVANTVHPWSVGSIGLYSREYYERIAASLRVGGIALQWLPIDRIGAENLADTLRTFYTVFEEGALFWGADNVLLVGSADPLSEEIRVAELPDSVLQAFARSGIERTEDLLQRHIASADVVRRAIGPGLVLSDDRPVLEVRRTGPTRGERALIEKIARAEKPERPLSTWIASLAARQRGETALADELENQAARGGLSMARRARATRAAAEGEIAHSRNDVETALRHFRRALSDEPNDPAALLGLAMIDLQLGEAEAATATLQRLLAAHPDNAPAWNLLGVVRLQTGDALGSRNALERAIDADPYLHEALANAGLVSIELGDLGAASRYLARMRALDLSGPSDETRNLAAALAARGGS